jgi:hypothetical protein
MIAFMNAKPRNNGLRPAFPNSSPTAIGEHRRCDPLGSVSRD